MPLIRPTGVAARSPTMIPATVPNCTMAIAPTVAERPHGGADRDVETADQQGEHLPECDDEQDRGMASDVLGVASGTELLRVEDREEQYQRSDGEQYAHFRLMRAPAGKLLEQPSHPVGCSAHRRGGITSLV